jgi:hypothetical protein
MLSEIIYIGSGHTATPALGFGEIINDGNGNLSTTRYLDDQAAYLQPVYQIANVPANANLTVRVTTENANGTTVSRIALKQNFQIPDYYDQVSSKTLASPGNRRTKVTHELYNGNELIGTFIINFAPKSEEPEGFSPIIDPAGRFSAPQNVRIEDGFIRWDAVENAEMYWIYVFRCDDQGNSLSSTQGIEIRCSDLFSDNLINPQESISDIVSFLELPAGNYKFTIRASSLSNGFLNATLASKQSAATALVVID